MNAQPNVLIVGAGPVGLMAAVRLALNGVPVTIIDQRPRVSCRSYACALHPHTLELLDSVGLASAAVKRGRSVDTVAFYDAHQRQTEVRLSDLTGSHPFALCLAQSSLEDLLERRLADLGVSVQWNRRLAGLRHMDDGISARIASVTQSGDGCLLGDSVIAVRGYRDASFQFVVGADGAHSLVREHLGVRCEPLGRAVTCAMYEFRTDAVLPHEVRVVLDEGGVSVLWPLSDHRCRWTFEMSSDGTNVHGGAGRFRYDGAMLEGLIRERARWFTARITELDWGGVVRFTPGFVPLFGRDRCWLAGDAAHQALPFGVQSMNIGLREALDLADAMAEALKGHSARLWEYADARAREWHDLLSAAPFEVGYPRNEWAAAREQRIAACLPESGPRLKVLCSQLGLHWRDSSSGHSAHPEEGVSRGINGDGGSGGGGWQHEVGPHTP